MLLRVLKLNPPPRRAAPQLLRKSWLNLSHMPTPRFLVSLTTSDNDYQIEQAQSAEQAANKLGVEVQIVFADNDAITQSTQVLKAIQSSETARPSAIIFDPVGGTALPQIVQPDVSVGIGWAVLNRDAAYIADLRKSATAPIFG